jgi:hypothetical protein
MSRKRLDDVQRRYDSKGLRVQESDEPQAQDEDLPTGPLREEPEKEDEYRSDLLGFEDDEHFKDNMM